MKSITVSTPVALMGLVLIIKQAEKWLMTSVRIFVVGERP